MSTIISHLERLLPRKKMDAFGKDSLINSSLPYYIVGVLSASGLVLNQTNSDPFFFIFILYVVFPLLDEFFRLDERNPSQEQRRQLERNDEYFRITLYVAMIIDWAVFIKGCFFYSEMEIGLHNIFNLVGFVFIMSNQNSVQFVIAHQILHKPAKFYRILGTIHMLKLHYTHFTYHHLTNHHHKVATPEDPSSAAKGDNVYSFFVSCVKGSFIGVYQEEKKLGKRLYNNYAILSIIASLSFTTFIYLIFGLQSTIIHLIIAFGAIFYLEAISFLQHYGLRRRKLPNGDYEKVTIMHAWNAPQRFTNYLLFKLQRHSDHHAHYTKPFQTLVSLEKSPFLPHGYTLMVLMTLFPKVWFKIMDPLVDEYTKVINEEKDKINEQVRQIAITETRKFMIKLAIFMTSIWILSLVMK